MRSAIGQFSGLYSTVRPATSKTLFLRALFVINILLTSFLSPYCKLQTLVFPPLIYGPRPMHLDHKSMGKNVGRNLQYSPGTRLVRGM